MFDPQKVAGAERHGRQPFDFAVYRTSFGLRKAGLIQFTFRGGGHSFAPWDSGR
jgi:hypothetical protein